MKLKTIQEIGKFTDSEMETYNKVKDARLNRTKKDAIYNFADMPMALYIFFSCIAISGILIYTFLIFLTNAQVIIIYSAFTEFQNMLLLFIISAIPVMFTFMVLLAVELYKYKVERAENIKNEIYK